MSDQTITTPTHAVRVRIAHSRTIKEGWSYSTTVEVTEHNGPIDMDNVQSLLEQVRIIGETERDERNRRDAARHEGHS